MSIGQTAARGVAWNMAIGVGSRAVQLLGTLLLTRFIAPEAYGEVLAASLAVVLAGTLTSFAFGQYLIAQRADAAESFQAMVVHVVLGAITMGVLIGLQAPLSRALGSPGMQPYLWGFALAHVLECCWYMPTVQARS